MREAGRALMKRPSNQDFIWSFMWIGLVASGLTLLATLIGAGWIVYRFLT